MSSFTPAGSGGVPLDVVTTASGSANPSIANVAMTTAGTEYSYTLPDGTRQYSIKLRTGNGLLQISYVSGQSGTIYDTIPRYCYASESGLKLTGPLTLYFQSNLSAQVAEIRVWT